MKKVIAFLLVLFIFVSPVTTLVKADVVIGDNDETIINENALILGRKLALMESLSDLALSGVTEFTISNTNDVDSYLDYLWSEIGDAIDSLSDGTGFTEISNQLKSKYFTNLVQYKDYITNRGNYLAQLLPSGSPTTTLLSTFFANNVYGKQYTQHYDLALDMFRSLSELNNPVIPQPDTDYNSYLQIINSIQTVQGNYDCDYLTGKGVFSTYSYYKPVGVVKPIGKSFYCRNYNNLNFRNAPTSCQITCCASVLDININSTLLSFSVANYVPYWIGIYTEGKEGNESYNCDTFFAQSYNTSENAYSCNTFYRLGSMPNNQTGGFNNLESIFIYLSQRYKHVNIYVDGIPWSLVDTTNNSPTLDIDGLLKIYGNDYPQQYELQPYTKIDYDQLYQVIYNAIRDNLPISQGDINYYDSHDTIYSPTIINNYGEEEGDESDLIDTILDYAVIPKFDTAIAQPMRSALTNGVVIMNNSITNVIPQEILIILGACFFLLLFAVVINRMIK